jgi:RHS repeat-associated protein
VQGDSLANDQNKLILGRREYELSNHLGNVLATVSDAKLPAAKVLSFTDYYAFGGAMPGRSGGANYRYGFNGKENDKDFGNAQLIQDYGFRIYNPAIGKFLSVDPLTQSFPWNSPYAFAENRVIDGIDLEGAERHSTIGKFSPDYGFTQGSDHAPDLGQFASNIHYDLEVAPKIWAMNSPNIRAVQRDERQRAMWQRQAYYRAQGKYLHPNGQVYGLGQAEPDYTIEEIVDLALGVKSLFKWGLKSIAAHSAKKTAAALAAEAEGIAYVWEMAEATRQYGRYGKTVVSRGTIFEEYLARNYYQKKGIQWFGGGTDKATDFYDAANKTGISLKTTNATSGFDNIKENIKQLVQMKADGVDARGNAITNVELHIAVPQGYNQSHLNKIIKSAEDQGIKVKVREIVVGGYKE